MTVHVYLLHGGVYSFDGLVTSVGMNTLVGMLRKLPGVEVMTFLWASWTQCYREIMLLERGELRDDKVALIGYSGGAMKCTWVANGCVLGGDGRIRYEPRPRIDLLVAYDPSPAASVQMTHDNVKRAICYQNAHPFFLGLGGGALHGPNVELVPISMNHMAVQFSGELHKRTLNEVRRLITRYDAS